MDNFARPPNSTRPLGNLWVFSYIDGFCYIEFVPVLGHYGCGPMCPISQRPSFKMAGANNGGFGAYLIVLRKRFAMTLHILGIAVE